MGDNKGEDTCENDAVLPWNFTVPKMCDNNKYNKHETDCNEGTPEFICYKSGQDDEKLLILEDYLNELPGSSKIIEDQKTPHSNKHKARRKKSEDSEHDNIQTCIKKERTTPAPIIKFKNYEDIWSDMVNREEVTKKSRNSKIFADRSTYLPRMRAILLDWIMEVCEVYRLRRTTYYLTIDYIDRYLTLKPSVLKTQLQLLGVTCLFIASKLEEIYPPKLSEFSYVCDGACTEVDILSCEILLLSTLQWDVNPMTPTTWLNLYMQIYCSADHGKKQLSVDTENHFYFPQYSAYQFVRASHLIDLFSMDPGFLRFSYSVIAAGAMCYILGKEAALFVSGYQWKKIEACVEYMAVFHRLIKESADTRLQNICTQDLDDSLLGNFRFLKKRIRTLVNDESHSMQTHVVDLDFFERATLLRLEQLGMRVEKTLVKRRKRSSERIQIPDDEKTDVRDDTEQQKTEVNVDDTNIGEATIVMYEIEKILDEHVNKCLDIFDLTDERDKNDADNYLISLTEENAKKDDQEDVKGVVNILKIDRKTKLSFDDILSSMHNDYYEQKYK